jgi:hypothetical protein
MVTILAPVVEQKKGEFKQELVEFMAKGFYRFMIDGQMHKFSHVSEIEKLGLKKKQFYDEFFTTQSKSALDKALFITRVMEEYMKTDYEKNMEKFDGIESAQMSWLWEYVTNKLTTKEIRDVFLASVFDKLETLVTVTSDAGVNTKNIVKMIKSGQMFDVEGKVSDFYEDMGVFFQPTPPVSKNNTPSPIKKTPPPDYCNISGGKRKN